MTVDEAINEQIEKVAPPVKKATKKEVDEYGEPALGNDEMGDARRYYEMFRHAEQRYREEQALGQARRAVKMNGMPCDPTTDDRGNKLQHKPKVGVPWQEHPYMNERYEA